MAQLITTLGATRADELGLILPHEQVFVDLPTCDQPGCAQAFHQLTHLNPFRAFAR